MDIVQFINDRLRDDEAYARLVLSGYAGHVPEWECISTGVLATGEELYPLGDGPLAEHIARHDPARVLAEVAAKRQLAKLHSQMVMHGDGPGAAWYDMTTVCRTCDPPRQFPETAWPCLTARLLAAPYAGHPDYNPAWRPE